MDQNAKSGDQRARRGFIGAAIVVGATALAGIVVAITATTAPQETQTDQPTNTLGPLAAGEGESVCGLKDSESEALLSDAPDTWWVLVGTVAAPTDPEGAGPGVTEASGFRSCYAHTAKGALYAAANFVALGSDGTLRPKLSELVARGPGKEAVADSQASADPGSMRAQIAGYKIEVYDASLATVDLALNYSTGALVSLPIKLVWEDGDWKLVLTDTGALPLPPVQLQSLGGYTPWSGA